MKEDKKEEIKPTGGLYKGVKVTKEGLDKFLIIFAILVIIAMVVFIFVI